MEKFGIENLKKVVNVAVTIGKGVTDSIEDGKVTLTEVLELVTPLMAVPALIENKQAIIDEALDLSTDEVDELVKSFEGVTNENLTDTIVDGLTIIVSAKNLIERFGKKAA